ncbi:MAG: hypothetical protein EAZ57_04945 [Cytophagales bacterium]|nr:MAG: hypothetical protein EAZ67_00935 [Cytophagales bacterium]TAF61140.1 MAG: hypothetical protein EAZ57_04945 [Cytophagales bacterium]
MFAFIVWILLTVWMFVCFRLLERYQARTFQVIVVNYWACCALGFSLHASEFTRYTAGADHWLVWALGLGVMFISTFYLTGLATKALGLSVVTLASKLSFVIPSLLSLFLIPSALAEMTWLKWLGLLLGFVAVFCSVYQPKTKNQTEPTNSSIPKNWWLPLLVFVMGGLVDAFLNIANERFFVAESNPFFVISIFGVSAFLGSTALGIMFYKDPKARPKRQEFLWGALLGIPNYASVEVMLLVLKDFNNNGALVFPVYNLSIIGLSALIGAVFFAERLNAINYLGLALACLTIFLMLF